MVESGRSTLVDFIRTSPENFHQLPIYSFVQMVESGRSTLVDFIRTSPENFHQLPISLTFFDTKKEAKKYSPHQGLPAGGGCKQIIAAHRRLFLCFSKPGHGLASLSAGAWRVFLINACKIQNKSVNLPPKY